MRLVRGLTNLTAATRGTAVAIGNFDGVHRGHQALVAAALACAARTGAEPVVLTFDPHPREFIGAGDAPPRLMRVTEKLLALGMLGIKRLVVVRFNRHLQELSAAEFIDHILVGALNARHVIVGEGFRFGRQRDGTVDTLCSQGAGRGFDVVAVPSVRVGQVRVSSTAIRDALLAGNLVRANELLGARYALTGRVIKGAQLGRELGYPTANMRLHRPILPLKGIFAVFVRGVHGNAPCAGVASLGTRPTVNGVEPLLEVHLFDYSGNLYGRRLRVEFVAKLRDEERFDSLDVLTAQMHRDAAAAREILKTYSV